MAHLREEEIEGLSLEMARLSPVGEETAESIFTELAAVADDRRIGRRRHRLRA